MSLPRVPRTGRSGLPKPFGYLFLSFPLRCFFYLVTPGETTFESPEDVPDVISMIIPYFVVMIAVEAFVCQFKGRNPRTDQNNPAFKRLEDIFDLSTACKKFQN